MSIRAYSHPYEVKRFQIAITGVSADEDGVLHDSFGPEVLWGFASITNNATQHVTIFSRQ